jgi:hypothetical protein
LASHCVATTALATPRHRDLIGVAAASHGIAARRRTASITVTTLA